MVTLGKLIAEELIVSHRFLCSKFYIFSSRVAFLLCRNFPNGNGHFYVAGRRNMRESVLAVLLAWTLAAQQGLCGNLEKVALRPNNVLEDFSAYRHISIIHFEVPERIVAAVFKYV